MRTHSETGESFISILSEQSFQSQTIVKQTNIGLMGKSDRDVCGPNQSDSIEVSSVRSTCDVRNLKGHDDAELHECSIATERKMALAGWNGVTTHLNPVTQVTQ